MSFVKLTQTEIEQNMQTMSFMHVVVCENEPNHACCAYNDCEECAPYHT